MTLFVKTEFYPPFFILLPEELEGGGRVGDDGGVEAGFELGEPYPFFVHFGVAGIVNPAKIEDFAIFGFGCLHGGPSK